MAKSKKSRSPKPRDSWTDLAAKSNAAIQLGEPFLPALVAAKNGDIPGAIAAAKPALAEASSMKNVGQIATGFLVRGLAKKGMRAFKVKNPTLFGRRLM